MKIKIGLKSQPASSSSTDSEVFDSPKISINSKKEPSIDQPSIDHPILLSSECDLDRHIRDYFLEPLKDLINNDGVSNGFLIANVDALLIMKKILKSILKKKKISIVEILEKAAFENSEETEAIENDSHEENSYEESEEEAEEQNEKQEDDQDEDEEDEEEDEEDEEEDEEEFDEYDLEEARECDSYCYDEDESMDG